MIDNLGATKSYIFWQALWSGTALLNFPNRQSTTSNNTNSHTWLQYAIERSLGPYYASPNSIFSSYPTKIQLYFIHPLMMNTFDFWDFTMCHIQFGLPSTPSLNGSSGTILLIFPHKVMILSINMFRITIKQRMAIIHHSIFKQVLLSLFARREYILFRNMTKHQVSTTKAPTIMQHIN